MKLLICDDDPMTLKALEYQFKNAGLDVIKANNGKDAKQMLSDDPDIGMLVTDLYMPMINGMELITHVRKVLNSEMPILILTRANVSETISHAFELGADDYLTKPFNLEEMSDKIEQLMHKKPN